MDKKLSENLKRTLKTYRGRFLKGVLLVLLSNTLLIVNPLVFRMAIQQTSSWLSLAYWLGLMLLIATLAALFKYSMRISFISISRDVERDVRGTLFRRIQNQSQAFFDRHGTGELLSRLTNDITAYRDMLGPGMMYPIFAATLVIPGVVALMWISPYLAICAVVPLGLIPLLNVLLRKPIYTTSKEVQEELASLSNLTQEHYSGMKILRCYGAEASAQKQFDFHAQNLSRHNYTLSILQGLLWPFFGLVAKGITVIIVFFSGWLFLRGITLLSPADFASFMWIQSYIFYPVLTLGWVVPIYQRGRAAYDRLTEIYFEPVEVQDKAETELKIPHLADIAFHHLTFAYPNRTTPALRDVSFEIKGGSFIGITGHVGAGKSTLFRLLNREYEIPRGMISIQGRDIHDYPLSSFHEEVVSVEQIPFLFSKSIADNVRFGKEGALIDEVEMVSRFADLHDTVIGFPNQYDTLVGERGVRLSGGQKLRVAMARAFLVNRSILLLDNIFSAVDTDTEKRIFEAMKKNFVGRTVLLVTGRTSVLHQLDRVIYMKDGEVIEDGAPKDLMRRGGPYSALWELQQLKGGSS